MYGGPNHILPFIVKYNGIIFSQTKEWMDRLLPEITPENMAKEIMLAVAHDYLIAINEYNDKLMHIPVETCDSEKAKPFDSISNSDNKEGSN